MSLTAFLDNRDVKDRFRAEFSKPWFTAKKEILAPPLTDHYGLVGTAFDYLLRFYAERLNAKAVAGPWIAERSAASILVSRDELLHREANRIIQIIQNARENHSSFLRTGRLTDGLLRSTLLLAQLDPIFRVGAGVDEHLGTVHQKDVTDLRNLFSLVSPPMLKAKRVCLLNPTFGKASNLVGGADADIVIDDLLMDVKTTKNLEMGREEFNQQVGYYVLYRIGGIDALPPRQRIRRLGIYFSRYGYLHVIPVRDVVNEKTLPRFLRWFEKRAQAEYGNSI